MVEPNKTNDLSFDKMAQAILLNQEKVTELSNELNRRTQEATAWFNNELDIIIRKHKKESIKTK